jgi:arginine exporter protein ArgO
MFAGSGNQVLPANSPATPSCAPSTIVISDFVSGALAGLAVALPIGAVGSYLVGLGARERISVAAAAALGVASVDGGYAVIAALGGAGLQALLSTVSSWLERVAAIVLAGIAIRTVRGAVRRYRGKGISLGRLGVLTPARAYFSLVALTALNPATVITFAAVAMGRSSSTGGSSWATVALFAIGAFIASAAWQLLLTGSGNLLGRLLSGSRGQLAISVCSALIMLGLAVGLLLN